jgi:UDP-N-acetyl-D-glucosamine dehydrogenase
MPAYVLQRCGEALEESRQTIRGSRILMIGIAYKANVDDDRESPAYVLWEMLEKQGAQDEYYDPHVPVIRPSREHAQFAGRKSAELTGETVASFDLVLVATHHKAVDWPLIAQNARFVVDSRNALSTAMKGKPSYFKA